jgi:hypothetical protein
VFANLLSLHAPGSLYTADPVVSEHPLIQGRVGWWLAAPPLEGGRQWFDLLNRNHGTLTNAPAWVGPSGRPGGYGALSFNGTSQYADCGAVLSGSPAKVTVAGWMNRTSTSALAFFGWGGTTQNRLGPLWFTDGNLYFFGEGGNNNFPAVALAGTGWHHVALVYNGALAAGSRVAGYVDGRSQTLSGGGTDTPTYDVIGTFRIGEEADFGRYTTGYHDDVTVYSRALSATEVFALYEQSRRGHPDTLRWLGQRIWFPPSPAAGGATFQPAWARGSNQWIGPGVWTC